MSFADHKIILHATQYPEKKYKSCPNTYIYQYILKILHRSSRAALVCCMGPVYHNRSSKDRRQLTNKMHQKWQKWQQLAPKHIFFLNSEAYQVQPNTHTWRSLIHIFSKIFLLLAIFSLIMQCTARLTFSPLVQCISMFD